MNVGRTIGLLADVHGSTRVLQRALDVMRESGVETVALLGDLFDRPEQADPCADTLAGWHVIGVYGNHERELAEAAAAGELAVRENTFRLLASLRDRVEIEDILLLHEVERWEHADPLARILSRNGNGHQAGTPPAHARITFAGHTHVRAVRDERGPIDVARGTLVLDPARRYLINPGALAVGQFAILDRTTSIVSFRHVDW